MPERPAEEAFELLRPIDEALRRLRGDAALRTRRVVDSACSVRLRTAGQEVTAFCSNDYLGLAAHPALADALAEGARRYGAGSGASPLISGHSVAHAALEEKIAALFAPHLETPGALLFSSGYAANLALIPALAETAGGADCDIFSASLNHASLIDAARLARGRSAGAAIHVYPHRDCEALDEQLRHSRARVKIIATDTVFSMDGELAPLTALVELAERHGAWLIVDDAHGFGVLGTSGRGALEHCGIRSRHVVYVGTLGKAAGVAGAFVAAHERAIGWLVNRARPYVYSTAPPPALSHALGVALELVTGPEGARRRRQLGVLIELLRASTSLRAWRFLRSSTPIQPLVIGANDHTLTAAAFLLRQGLWVPAIRPPTVPEGTARLRISLSADHRSDDITRLAAALSAAEEDLSVEAPERGLGLPPAQR